MDRKVMVVGLPHGAFIRAELTLKATVDVGRHRPIGSGYRCNCWIGREESDERAYNDAVVYLEAASSLAPGSTATVRLQPAYPELWSTVEVGSTVEVCEGSRVVGRAAVTELFPPS